MTSLTIDLPDELVERAERVGVLQSSTLIYLIEQKIIQAEQEQQSIQPRSIVDALSMSGLSNIEVDFPKLNIGLKPVEFD